MSKSTSHLEAITESPTAEFTWSFATVQFLREKVFPES